MTVLYAYAAAVEGQGIIAILGAHNVIELGVGKTQAAANLSAELFRRKSISSSVDAVILFGIAGAYVPPQVEVGNRALAIGQVCLVESDCLADEGVLSESDFVDLQTLGLAEIGPWFADSGWTRRLAKQLETVSVRGATVSTCSGNDSLARTLALRSGAQIESMEGAAVSWVCQQYNVPFAQIRCISNWTGDRKNSQWNLQLAITNLQHAVVKIHQMGEEEEKP